MASNAYSAFINHIEKELEAKAKLAPRICDDIDDAAHECRATWHFMLKQKWVPLDEAKAIVKKVLEASTP